MKHRLPTPKSARARSVGNPEPEQPELLAEGDSREAAPGASSANKAFPPPLPLSPFLPIVNNAPENPVSPEPPPAVAEPLSDKLADQAKVDDKSTDSPVPALSGSDTTSPPANQAHDPSSSPEVRIPTETTALAPLTESPASDKESVNSKTRPINPPPLPPPVPQAKAQTESKLTTPEPASPVLTPTLVAIPITELIAASISTKAVEKPVSESPSTQSSSAPTTPPASDAAHFLIQTRGLVKQYGGRRVVNGVDIYVRPGEVVGLLGKNGAGKTTTFYMIVGLVTPTEGHVFMGHEDVTRMPMYRRARRGIGYLPQEESIFRKLTVEENLLAILETLPLTEEERDARCDDLLRDFGLEHVRESVSITLSGGEKRRVTIARALVTSPSLLLLDEPFAGVDPMAVHDIQEIILKLKNKGMGVLLTDHSVRETLSVVDRAYIIDEGRVLSEGSKEFLLNDPIAREIYLGHRFSM